MFHLHRANTERARAARALLLAASATLSFQTLSNAVPRSWEILVTDGNWNDAANWVPSGQPANGDDILLLQSDSTDRLVHYINPAGVDLNSLTIDGTASGLMTMEQLQDRLGTATLTVGGTGTGAYRLGGGTLNADRAYIGPMGIGSMTQSGGTLSVQNYLSLGEGTTGFGNYAFSGGARMSTPEFDIGYYGTGTMSQGAGTITISTFMGLGVFPGARGTYDMVTPEAVLDAPRVFIGLGGAGTFTQVHGVNNAGTVLSVGELAGSIGSYTIGGTASVTTPEFDVGFVGIGVFNQNGGIVNSENINLAARTGSSGTYNMAAGTINATDLIVAIQTGTNASFAQAGGTANFGGDLSLAYEAGSRGAYTLDGGNVNANRVQVGGSPDAVGGLGTLTVNGGDFDASGTLTVWNRSIVRFNGGELSAHALELHASRVILGPGSGRVLRVGNLLIDPDSRVDLNDNKMIVDYTGATPIGTIRAYLQTAYDGGTWARPGLTTNLGNGTVVGLGYAEASDVYGISGTGTASFAGHTVDATSVLVKFTFFGDADLSGEVDVIDLGLLATNWQTNANWFGGDMNYDGFVDVIDLGLLATNWQAGVGNPLGPGSLQEALAQLGLPGVSVPEPVSWALLGAAAAGLGIRRRRW